MRDFGFGRRFDELEKHINDELLSLVDVIKNGPKFEYEKVNLWTTEKFYYIFICNHLLYRTF